jgi:hypothetical protein
MIKMSSFELELPDAFFPQDYMAIRLGDQLSFGTRCLVIA